MTTRIQFTHEMDELSKEVEEMGEMARLAIEKAVKLIVTGDYYLKDEVRKLDKELYRYEMEIEKHCTDIIALYTPVASDLRRVSVSWKVIEDLSRIGRYAWDIAEIADVFDGVKFKKLVSLPQMASLVVAMVTDSVDYYTTGNAVEARKLFDRDDEVDELYDTIFREMLTYMFEDPKKITVGIHYILIARYLERVADHSCNIGERVVYMVTGERWDPANRKRKIPPTNTAPEEYQREVANNRRNPTRTSDVGDFHQHELAEK
jgi:phosphate transport system protein